MKFKIQIKSYNLESWKPRILKLNAIASERNVPRQSVHQTIRIIADPGLVPVLKVEAADHLHLLLISLYLVELLRSVNVFIEVNIVTRQREKHVGISLKLNTQHLLKFRGRVQTPFSGFHTSRRCSRPNWPQ